jgi:hypothetical protein
MEGKPGDFALAGGSRRIGRGLFGRYLLVRPEACGPGERAVASGYCVSLGDNRGFHAGGGQACDFVAQSAGKVCHFVVRFHHWEAVLFELLR